MEKYEKDFPATSRRRCFHFGDFKMWISESSPAGGGKERGRLAFPGMMIIQ